MKVIITKDEKEMSAAAFGVMQSVVKANPRAVLGLATGTTPLGLYRNMIEDHKANGTSYKGVTTFNLDEYIGVDAENPNSYAYFMRENLFRHIDVLPENTNIENGMAVDYAAECARYNRLLAETARDLQLLGLGSNGHIAFNEPKTPFGSETHATNLTESTIKDNARLFDKEEDVPRMAFTMGIKNIMNAKKVLILACGKNKAWAVRAMSEGQVTEDVPASVLQLHPDCTLIVDEAAATLLEKKA